MIQGLDYWYDAQMRRYLEQVVKAFSGFQYEIGARDGTAAQTLMVPCRMANTDRMVANILRNNSENTILSVPMITVAMIGLEGRREDLQNPNHVRTQQINERKVDQTTGRYTDEVGRSYTVQMLMPRPFKMTVQVDIWTSNMLQKHQLMEQILTVVYPDFFIQNSDNAMDWSALTTMSLRDINWTSRTVPVGTDNDIEIGTLTFEIPFWLTPPAKVRQQRIIEQIVNNINSANLDGLDPRDGTPMTRVVVTPGDHHIQVEGTRITLLNSKAGLYDPQGEFYDWPTLIARYGVLRPTETQIRLKTDLEDDTHDIIGTVQYNNTYTNELIFQIDPDTLPSNTLGTINAVIDPLTAFPGDGLPALVTGTRYLLINDIANAPMAWGDLNAKANEIIEWRGGMWHKIFSPTTAAGRSNQYVLNLMTGRQLRWNKHDWVLSVDGTYPPGLWRLSI
jgi:hypothetical protein